MHHLSLFFRSLAFRSIFFFVFLISALQLPVVLLHRAYAPKLLLYWCKLVINSLRRICRVTVELKGIELLPPAPFIIASKHQSAFETIFFASIFDNPTFVMKKELLFIPVLNIYMFILKMLWIDRSSGVIAIKKIQSSSKTLLLKEKRPLIIFPEGTRVDINQEVSFSSGLTAIHRAAPEVPIFGAALNSGLLWHKKNFIIMPGKITVQILPQCHETDAKLLTQKIQQQVNHMSNQLCS